MPECPVCGADTPSPLLQDHVEAHLLEEEAPRGQAGHAGAAARPRAPPLRTAAVVVDLTNDDDDDDARQPPSAAGGRDTDGDAALAASLALEEQCRGGRAKRAGPLWERKPLSLLPGCHAADTPSHPEARTVHSLLRRALTAAGSAKSYGLWRAALCAGPLTHWSTVPGLDDGWGCGWRNCQHIASHLLARGDEDIGDALFGGSRSVPDIPSLQMWLESAWVDGFDAAGAAQLGPVQGMDTWIGSVEAAAMFRSFGLRANLVSFKAPKAGGGERGGGKRPRLGPGGGGEGTAVGIPWEPQSRSDACGGGAAVGRSGAAAVHAGVECDACGRHPIVGVRHASRTTPGCDLCDACVVAPGAVANYGPFDAIATPRNEGGSGGGSGAFDRCDPGAHAPLVEWVWNYFTTDVKGAKLPPKLGEQVRAPFSRNRFF